MPPRRIRLVRQSFPQPETFDTAVSHAILRRVSDGLEGETLRLHRPGDIVAFGPMDRHAPGYAEAIAAARSLGFGAVLRLAGGRAAVFHRESIAFSWTIPDPSPRTGIPARFEQLSGLLVEAFRDLGVDARVGEVPGEYCPGAHSVNAGGRTKLMGVGQRILPGAAHVGGVIVVGDAARVRDVLVPVYRALGLSWDPATSGSLRDEVPGTTWEDVCGAIVRRFAERFDLMEAEVSADELALARTLAPRHEAAPAARAGS